MRDQNVWIRSVRGQVSEGSDQCGADRCETGFVLDQISVESDQ